MNPLDGAFDEQAVVAADDQRSKRASLAVSDAPSASAPSRASLHAGLFFGEGVLGPGSDEDDEEKQRLVGDVPKRAAPTPGETDDEGGGASLATSTFNLCNVCLGAGTLAMPFAFRNTGIAFGLILLTLIYVLMALSAVMLCDAAIRVTPNVSTVTYGGIMRAVFGHRGTVAVQWIIVVAALGISIAYFQLVGDLVAPVVAYWMGDGPEEYCSAWAKRRTPMFFALAVEVALCVLPTLSALRYVSLVAVVSMMYLTFVVAYDSIVDDDNFAPGDPVEQFLFSGDVFRSIGLLTFAFAPHIQVVQMLAEFERPTPKRIRVWIWSSLTLCWAIYAVVGAFGYAAFRSQTEGNILLNHSAADMKITIGRIGVAVSVLAGYPTMCAPCASALDGFFFPHKKPSVWGRRLLWVFFVIAVSFLIAYVVEDVSLVLGLTGAGALTVAAFLLPAAIYLAVNKEELGLTGSFLMVTAWVIIVVGSVFGTVSVVVTLMEAFDPSDDETCIWPLNCPDVRCCPDAGPRFDPPIGVNETCPVPT
ncbi:Vacuolar amino acid transporter 5 [Diplonema papillatum]|nr:Vacuolar amino acid transporter 5 [Diplonema papillatum]